MSEAKQSNGMATASLILGIVSIVTFFMPYLAVVCAILAIIFAVVAKNKIKANSELAHTKGAATGGMITGIIGLIISVIVIVIAVMFVAAVAGAAGSSLEESMRELQNMKH
jgi:hypothetical protein